jgi:hypothetical protein
MKPNPHQTKGMKAHSHLNGTTTAADDNQHETTPLRAFSSNDIQYRVLVVASATCHTPDDQTTKVHIQKCLTLNTNTCRASVDYLLRSPIAQVNDVDNAGATAHASGQLSAPPQHRGTWCLAASAAT